MTEDDAIAPSSELAVKERVRQARRRGQREGDPLGLTTGAYRLKPHHILRHLPTPETARKHRRTSLERMIERNELRPEQVTAAQEIEAVYLAIAGGLMVRASSLEPRSHAVPRPIANTIAMIHGTRYRRWANALDAWTKRGGPPAFSVTIDVVVQGAVFRDIDRDRSWRNGTAKGIVDRALLEYAVEAGFLPRRVLF